jgi:hypothetical protein
MLTALGVSGLLALSAAAVPPDHVVLPLREKQLRVCSQPTLASAPPSQAADPDAFQIIARVPSVPYGAMAFGDSDHDGLNEVAIDASDGLGLRLELFENRPDGTYDKELVGPYVLPYAICDLDEDGNSEIFAQNSDVLQLYEAPSPSTHPTILVWTSPTLTNIIGSPTVGDTDRDGQMEIIHSINHWGPSDLVIYENTGDNTFAQRYLERVDTTQDVGLKVIADLDGDGLIEISFCGTYGFLHIIESPANDTWQEIFFDATSLESAYSVAGGVDTDGNGRPELFVPGDDGGLRIVYVYEAVADNSFVRVATLSYEDGYIGGLKSVVANTHGGPPAEYVLQVFDQLNVYRVVAPGEWVLSACFPDPDPPNIDHTALSAFDVNRNGRDELFWASQAGESGSGDTFVLEGSPTSDVGLPVTRPLSTLQVSPTPCRSSHAATIRVDSQAASAMSTLCAYDAAGRLVLREGIPPRAAPTFSLPAAQLPPGLYLLRVDDHSGRPLAIGRTVILR